MNHCITENCLFLFHISLPPANSGNNGEWSHNANSLDNEKVSENDLNKSQMCHSLQNNEGSVWNLHFKWVF